MPSLASIELRLKADSCDILLGAVAFRLSSVLSFTRSEEFFFCPFTSGMGGSENDEKIESCDEENCRIMYRKRMMMMVRESVAAETILN